MEEVINLLEGEVLMREGEPADSIFMLRSGRLEVLVKQEKVGEVKVGELVGDMAFMNASPRSATVVALNCCELLKISQETFEEALKGLPPWLFQYIHTLSQRIRDSIHLEHEVMRVKRAGEG